MMTEARVSKNIRGFGEPPEVGIWGPYNYGEVYNLEPHFQEDHAFASWKGI